MNEGTKRRDKADWKTIGRYFNFNSNACRIVDCRALRVESIALRYGKSREVKGGSKVGTFMCYVKSPLK